MSLNLLEISRKALKIQENWKNPKKKIATSIESHNFLTQPHLLKFLVSEFEIFINKFIRERNDRFIADNFEMLDCSFRLTNPE